MNKESTEARQKVIELLEAIPTHISTLLDGEDFQSETEQKYELSRAMRGIEFVGTRIRAADPTLLPRKSVDSLISALGTVHAHLQNVSSQQGDPNGELSSIRDAVDSAIRLGCAIPVAVSELEAAALGDTIDSLRSRALEYAAESKEQLEQLTTEVSAASEQIAGISNRAGDLEEQFNAFLEARSREFGAAEEQRATRFDSTLETQEQALGQLRSDFDTWLAGASGEYQKEVDSLSGKSDNLIEAKDELIEAEKERIFKDLQKLQGDVETVVGALTQTSMSGAYSQQANAERGARITWQVLASLSLLGLVGAGVWAAMAFTQGIWAVIPRGLVIFCVAGLAAYLGRLGAQHAAREDRYRNLALELSALPPFMAELEDEDRKAVVRELTTKYFGNVANVPQSSGQGPDAK